MSRFGLFTEQAAWHFVPQLIRLVGVWGRDPSGGGVCVPSAHVANGRTRGLSDPPPRGRSLIIIPAALLLMHDIFNLPPYAVCRCVYLDVRKNAHSLA